MVPLGGMISYGDIAARTELSEQMIRRLLRSAISMRIFQEPEPNMVAHTKSSKMLANPLANDWLRTGTEAMWPANVKVSTWAAQSISNGTDIPRPIDDRRLGEMAQLHRSKRDGTTPNIISLWLQQLACAKSILKSKA
jgi:hypothetical protein